jgi:hypothetical protein
MPSGKARHKIQQELGPPAAIPLELRFGRFSSAKDYARLDRRTLANIKVLILGVTVASKPVSAQLVTSA